MADFRLTQTGQQVQDDLNNAEQDNVKLEQHVTNGNIHVTPENKDAWNSKYNKPSGGIPKSDLAEAVQAAVNAALTAYQKPGTGIPKSDLASAVQTAIDAALTAYQKPGTGIPKTDLASAVQAALDAALTAYQKPNTGIPQSDMSADVQSKLNAAGSADAAIAAERLARETADLQINQALGTKLNESQVSALIAAAVANFVTGSDVASAITTALAPYSTTDQTTIAIQNAITTALASYYAKSAIDTMLAGKVDKVSGKGLSENDFTDTLKTKLDALPTASGLATQISTAIATALTDYYTKTQVDNALADKQTAAQVATAISTALASYSTTTQMNAAITSALMPYYTKSEIDLLLAAKQAVISDLSEIRSGAAAGATAYQKPQSGIPIDDLSPSVQAKVNASEAAQQAATNAAASADDAAESAEEAQTEAAAAAQKLTDLETYLSSLDPESAASVAAALGLFEQEVRDNYLRKGEYSADTAVGLADQLRGSVYADEQFAVRMTGGEANEVGGIGVVQQLKGAGAAISQLFPEGSGHDFSGDVSLDGTSGNSEAPVRYSDQAGTTEMGYLLVMEAFISQTLSQAQLDAISAKDTGKADRDKAVWLTPAGAITSAPTIESGQTEVTFSGWRIAMRVKASEVRDSSASSYWFTSGTAGRQVFDVAVAEGIDSVYPYTTFYLANGWNTGSAIEYLQHMAAQGLPTHSVKAMSALLAVTKIGIKTVKSRNLLNPQTGRALLKAYVNDADGFVDNEYTMLGGLPSGSTMAFTSLLTGKTETLTMLDSTHFVIPSDGWLQITGTLPESIICTWGGEKDNTAADEYATESHVWDVTQLFGTKDGGTEGHYYRFAKEGMRGAGTAQDVVELVGARGEVKVKKKTVQASDLQDKVSSQNIPYVAPLTGNYLAGVKEAAWQGHVNAICKFDSWFVSTYPTYANPRRNYIYSQNLCIAFPWYNTVAKITPICPFDVFYELATPLTFTSLFLSASSTSDELTQMPADAIPLSEIQFADNNWSIEEAVYDAPEADANGVITPTAVTGQMRIQYSLDAAEQIDTLQKEYAALEARVSALENA